MYALSHFPPPCSKLHITRHLWEEEQPLLLKVAQDGCLLPQVLEGRLPISGIRKFIQHKWVSKKFLLYTGHMTCKDIGTMSIVTLLQLA